MADDAGDLLVRSGLIAIDALNRARTACAELGGTISEHLLLGGEVTDETLTEFYRSRLLVPQVNPDSLAQIPPTIIGLIPGDMAIELRAVPVSRDREGNLTVAMSDPSNRKTLDELAFFSSAYVVRAVATQMQIAWCLAHYYGHVTELGRRLLRAQEPQAAARAHSVTGEVHAARRSVKPPVTAPPPNAPPAATPTEAAASEAPARARATDPPSLITEDPALTEFARSVAPGAQEVAVEHEMPELARFDDDEPEIEISGDRHGSREQVDTQPSRMSLRRKITEIPELRDRAGEVTVRAPTLPAGLDLPAVVVDLPPVVEELPPVIVDLGPAAGGEVEAPVSNEASVPILLDKPRLPGSASNAPPAESAAPAHEIDEEETQEVLLLDRRKVTSPPATKRAEKPTQVGLGHVGDRRVRPSQLVSAVLSAPPEMRQGNSQAVKVPMELLPDEPTQPNPTRAAIAAPPPTAPPPQNRPTAQEIDDGWGEPGTTIPPPLFGASLADSAPTAIPLAADVDLSQPLLRAPTRQPDASVIVENKPATMDPAARLLQLLTDLEAASARDAVIEILVDYLAATHLRAGFFAIKQAALAPFVTRPKGHKKAELRLDHPSTFQDVVATRLAYAGPIADADSRELLRATFGVVPAEIVVLPVAIRERVVGVVYADGRTGPVHDEHLALAARAGGVALERILKAKHSAG